MNKRLFTLFATAGIAFFTSCDKEKEQEITVVGEWSVVKSEVLVDDDKKEPISHKKQIFTFNSDFTGQVSTEGETAPRTFKWKIGPFFNDEVSYQSITLAYTDQTTPLIPASTPGMIFRDLNPESADYVPTDLWIVTFMAPREIKFLHLETSVLVTSPWGGRLPGWSIGGIRHYDVETTLQRVR